MDGLGLSGPLKDSQLEIVEQAALLVEGPLNRGGRILAVGQFEALRQSNPGVEILSPPSGTTVLPGLIDSHTHLCWAGTRARDFALRNSGATYLEMAEAGGGIRYTVRQTRAAEDEVLLSSMLERMEFLRKQGITTAECKSGYGLSVSEELRHLQLIAQAGEQMSGLELVSTCLAAHVCPPEFEGDSAAYLLSLQEELLPALQQNLQQGGKLPRIDAFLEPSAFWGQPVVDYLRAARDMGFELTVHADQFTPGGAELACALGALSADHLEHSDAAAIRALAASAKTGRPCVATALPGASLGLGELFSPARALLDAGACLAIASDWNPGSAPQGQLLAQACILAAKEKLSNAELWAAVSFRAAQALGLGDRGRLVPGMRADISVWPCEDYRDISWMMGSMPAYDVLKMFG